MSVRENLNRILKDIENYDTTLIAVTKYYDIEKMIEAFNAGLRNFAESKAIESIEKISKIDDTTRNQSVYHFIGHLQTNKVKYVVGNFDYIHSVDSLKLAQCIDLEAQKKGIIQKILIQVNNANEEQKFGIEPKELDNLINEMAKLKSIELKGLMNIAPYCVQENELRKLFSEMRELKERYGLQELSMGMSNDYKIALECGATMIRLGRILFEN
ncbi:MAG: YggS family pyridoxal phosphate-dependent enzyme [Candidatus Gastranaerophilales bacterium]|nr:YggS family pyridoxal phosphate-dependent enzyme [Candidatus Gastranaerophilales bacterium]